VRRSTRVGLIVVATALFLLVSGILARWLSLENVERSDVLSLVQAEARGDAQAMFAQLHGCHAHCQSDVTRDARTLRRAGTVQILAYHSPTAYTLTSAIGETRVAWEIANSHKPVVQCVRVWRRGNAISGLSIRLVSVSAPIPVTADC
jgi:hypothetical protein